MKSDDQEPVEPVKGRGIGLMNRNECREAETALEAYMYRVYTLTLRWKRTKVDHHVNG